MFLITGLPIEVLTERRKMDDPKAGAFVYFEGRVRRENEGKEVKGLAYEAYEALASKEGERILEEAATKFAIFKAVALHRTGKLEIGETAVWVGVTSAHRKDAFLACEYIIDEIKARVPIWKKESYADGKTEWLVQHTP